MGDLYKAIIIVEADGFVPKMVIERCKRSFMKHRNVVVRELKPCFDTFLFDQDRAFYEKMVKMAAALPLWRINNGWCTKRKPFVQYYLDEDLDIIGKKKWLGKSITIRVEFEKVGSK